MAVPDFQRARSAAAKQQRESAILEAARTLGAERGIRQITLTDIGEAIGMHKSALLRYFETREEIFLRLTADGWREWSAALRAGLEALAAPAPAAVAGVFASTLAARGLFCDLLAQAPLNLERHVSPDAVHAFKLVTLAEVDAIVAVVRHLLPGLTERDGVRPHRGRDRDVGRVLADGDTRARSRRALPERPPARARGRRRRTARRPAAGGHAGGNDRLVLAVGRRWLGHGAQRFELGSQVSGLSVPIMKGGMPVISGVGSTAVRDALAKYQPMLSLHGHIHESRGEARIGRTLAINPGSEYSEGVLRGAIITLNRKKGVRGYQLVAG